MSRFAGSLLALLCVLGCDRGDARREGLRAPAIGAAAPDYSAIDPTGAPVSLAALRGSVVVLNVWATWCRPCLEEIPQLSALHATFAPQGARVVGVSIDAAGMGADVTDFANQHQMRYTVWLDPDRTVSVKFLTMGVPETFVIDRQGIIRARVIGALRSGDTTLTSAVRRALERTS
jgi:peroxiredoxin